MDEATRRAAMKQKVRDRGASLYEFFLLYAGAIGKRPGELTDADLAEFVELRKLPDWYARAGNRT